MGSYPLEVTFGMPQRALDKLGIKHKKMQKPGWPEGMYRVHIRFQVHPINDGCDLEPLSCEVSVNPLVTIRDVPEPLKGRLIQHGVQTAYTQLRKDWLDGKPELTSEERRH